MKKNRVKSNPIKLFLFLFFVSLNAFSQYELSVPFPAGFIGERGTNDAQANLIKTFTTLGIAKAFFMQNSTSATTFDVVSTNVLGSLRLQLNSGQLIDIPGSIKWKNSGGTTNYLGFIPSPSFSSVSFSYGASLTYTIYGGSTTTSNIGLGLIGGSTADFVDGTSPSGNSSGFAADLNSYLTTTNLAANKPDGPVTVSALTTTDTTPTITGTVTLISGESLSIDVNNLLYTTANGLSIVGTDWTLPITTALALGTYTVVAKITSSAGYTLNDATTNELIITSATQGLTKYGGIETNPANLVDKNGGVGTGSGANRNGKMNLFKDGLTQARAASSASKIKQDYPASTDGVYWIDLPGVGPKQTYCLMDNKYDGGGWMLALKATTGNTFNYDADYWTTANTLNPTDVTLTDSDAKYDAMNNFQAKDMMAIWPDITVNSPTVTESGSIDNLDRWSWLQNDFHGGNRTTLISKFSGSQVTYETSTTGAMAFSGFNSGVFSSQSGYSFYGINYTGNLNRQVRWGFAWNNETDQGSNDASGGIGLDIGFGDSTYAYQSAGNITNNNVSVTSPSPSNRSNRVEIYIR